ncbi:MAG: outer membrane protein assembly factor BamE [Litorimonas sp.]
MKKILICAALLVGLAGCFGPQNQAVRSLDYTQATKAIPIGSSKETVIATLGKPEAINSFNGEEMWSYVDQQIDAGQFLNPLTSVLKSIDTKSYIIRFDRSGRVKSVDQTTFNL